MNMLTALKTSFIFFVAIQFLTTAIGQANKDNLQYIIKGKVFDSSTKEVLPFATLMVNHKILTTTNNNGSFLLDLPNKYLRKKFKIYVAYIGYNEKTIHVNNKSGQPTLILDTYLKKAEIDMNQVLRTDQ